MVTTYLFYAAGAFFIVGLALWLLGVFGVPAAGGRPAGPTPMANQLDFAQIVGEFFKRVFTRIDKLFKGVAAARSRNRKLELMGAALIQISVYFVVVAAFIWVVGQIGVPDRDPTTPTDDSPTTSALALSATL